jgi:hypothetical protein
MSAEPAVGERMRNQMHDALLAGGRGKTKVLSDAASRQDEVGQFPTFDAEQQRPAPGSAQLAKDGSIEHDVPTLAVAHDGVVRRGQLRRARELKVRRPQTKDPGSWHPRRSKRAVALVPRIAPEALIEDTDRDLPPRRRPNKDAHRHTTELGVLDDLKLGMLCARPVRKEATSDLTTISKIVSRIARRLAMHEVITPVLARASP